MKNSKLIKRRNHRRGERGQVLVLCAVCIVVLLLFIGLAVDFGFAYVAKARLGKAADAAALIGARYSGKGSAAATALAKSAFSMNYGSPSPVPNVTYCGPGYSCPDPTGNGDTYVNVNVTATIKTSFLGLLPGDNSVAVSSNAQTKAARVVMTLVLDRTGSMIADGGKAALPSAVADFINYFDDIHDTVALVSFANDVTVDVPFPTTGTGNFQQAIINAANAMPFQGATWSEGGLQQAYTTETAYTIPPATNPLRVVVFFTDGNANTIHQDMVTCIAGQVASGSWNVGGYDDQSTVGFLTPGTNPSNPSCSESDNYCCNGGANTPALPAYFNSQVAKGPMAINWTNISGPSGDARYRAIQSANNMRAAGIVVFAIGLGSATEPVDAAFLCQIANDPSCTPKLAIGATGLSQFVTSGSGLDSAFQTIAEVIRLRLTQ
jgi:Flp pilus assembly protein TadG